MEVNGRHNRSGLLSVACGINFPWIQYWHLTHGELPVIDRAARGIYWIDEFKDVSAIFRCLKDREANLLRCLRPYIRPNIYSVFDVGDLMPFLKRCGDVVRMMFRPETLRRACNIKSAKMGTDFRLHQEDRLRGPLFHVETGNRKCPRKPGIEGSIP